MATCFVIQPFDAGKFDGCYRETFKPAIEAAGFEAYRVDQDPSVWPTSLRHYLQIPQAQVSVLLL